MPSSTSSSEGADSAPRRLPNAGLSPRVADRRRRAARTQLACMALAVATFLGLVGATVVAWRLTPLRNWRMDIADATRPRAVGAYYLAHDRGGHVDHHVLYYGLDTTALRRARAAEVVFLGNSRLMFALPRTQLRRFFFDHDLSYYVLGFGHDEQDEFAKALIERQDLRPKLVIVNVDGFFSGEWSAWARQVVSEGPWDAQKLRFEAETTHAVRQYLHQIVPHWPDLFHEAREMVIYRSRSDGTWFVGTRFGEGTIFQEAGCRGDEPWLGRALQQAASFKAELLRRGTKVIFCYISNPKQPRCEAEYVAERLGVPLVAPRVPDLRTIDGSHLDDDSAKRFAEAFFDDLNRILDSPEFREYLAIPKGH